MPGGLARRLVFADSSAERLSLLEVGLGFDRVFTLAGPMSDCQGGWEGL